MNDSNVPDFMPSKFPSDEVDQSQVADVAAMIEDEQRLANLGLRGLASANRDELRRGIARLETLLGQAEDKGWDEATLDFQKRQRATYARGFWFGAWIGAAIASFAILLITPLL